MNFSTFVFAVVTAATTFQFQNGPANNLISAFTMPSMYCPVRQQQVVTSLLSTTINETERETKSIKVTSKSNNNNNKKKSTNYKKRPKKKFDKTRSLLSTNTKKGKKNVPANKEFTENLPLSSLEIGSKLSGVVAGTSTFGAFIRTSYALKPGSVGGYALLHKSQIQDEIVQDINKVMKVGQRLDNLRVISINYAKGEVNLSLRPPRPARKELSDIAIGDMLRGKVRNLTPYGAFVDVGCKVNLLIHKSRISTEKVENISDYVNTGDKVNVRVIDKDEKSKKLAGSLLRLDADLYLTKRQKQLEKKYVLSAVRSIYNMEQMEYKSETEIFDEAMDGLNDAIEDA